MSDTAVGFILIGVAMVVVLGLVFAISSRGGPAGERPQPPQGVHLPGPSYLPVVMSLGMLLLGAGLAFRSEGQIANLWIAIPGVAVLVLGIISWVRAANHEWRDTEHGSHDDGAAH
jgi:cytochrome c oxidase subunit 1